MENTRTAGPLRPGEKGPLSGQIVVPKGTPVWRGTHSRPAERDIMLNPPLDKGEVGTAWNGYEQSNNPLDP